MPDTFIKIIPINPESIISNVLINKAEVYLNSCINADSIKVYQYDMHSFIDCGSNLEEIRCPICNEVFHLNGGIMKCQRHIQMLL